MKIIKKSKNKIKCIRDEASGLEITPSELNLSEKYNDINISLLESALAFAVHKEHKVKLFDFLNDINYNKDNLIEGNESVYNEFIINKLLSYHQDCIFYVNEMNQRSSLPKLNQYKYYSEKIRKRKRFSKVHKIKENEDVQFLMKFYKMSERSAQSILEIIGSVPNELKEKI